MPALLHRVRALPTPGSHAPAPQRGGEARIGEHRGTRQALLVLALAQTALSLPTETLPFCGRLLEASPAAWPGAVLLVASQVLSIPALMLRGPRMWHAWVLFGMLLVSVEVCTVLRGDLDVYPLLIPGYWVFNLVVLALATMQRGRYMAFTLVSTLLLTLQSVLHDPPHTWFQASQVLWIVQPVVQVLVFGDVMVSAGSARDRSLEEGQRAELVRQREDLEAGARREAARLLHDHVLHALHALTHATPGTLRDLAVSECRSAHEVMTRDVSSTDDVSVEHLVRADPALAQLHATLEGSTEPLPRAIAQTIGAAVHEALQNVVRHARAEHTRVVLRSVASGIRVDVIDDGRGFDPSRSAVGRLGVQSSILQRMDDIGGEAHTLSAPGRGTRVVLQWPRTSSDEDTRVWTAAPETSLRRHLTLAVWPGLLTGLLMTFLAGPHLPQPLPAMTAALATLALGGLACLAVHRNPLTAQWLVALLVVAVASWLWNLWMVPTPPRYDYFLWMAWGASALVQLVVVSAQPSIGLGVVAGWGAVQAAGLLWRYEDPVWVWELSSLLSAGAGECLVTLLVLVVARRAARQQAEAARLATRLRTATAQLQMNNHLQRYWSRKVTEEALPLLSGVAGGRLDPTDPLVQREAAALETTLRDELVLGPNNAAMVRQLASTRASGWRLTSTLGRDDAPLAVEGARRLLVALGEPHAPGQVVTLSTGQHWAIAVVFDADAQQERRWRGRLEPLGGRLDVDPDFVRLTLPLPHAAGVAA